MKMLCDENDIVFYTNILNWNSDELNQLISFFDANKIRYIDCNVRLSEANTIRNDGHPDESVHEIWAERIANRLILDGIVN